MQLATLESSQRQQTARMSLYTQGLSRRKEEGGSDVQQLRGVEVKARWLTDTPVLPRNLCTRTILRALLFKLKYVYSS